MSQPSLTSALKAALRRVDCNTDQYQSDDSTGQGDQEQGPWKWNLDRSHAGRDFGSRSYVDHEHRGHAGDRQLRFTDLLVQYLRGIACIWWTKVGLGEVYCRIEAEC